MAGVAAQRVASNQVAANISRLQDQVDLSMVVPTCSCSLCMVATSWLDATLWASAPARISGLSQHACPTTDMHACPFCSCHSSMRLCLGQMQQALLDIPVGFGFQSQQWILCSAQWAMFRMCVFPTLLAKQQGVLVKEEKHQLRRKSSGLICFRLTSLYVSHS